MSVSARPSQRAGTHSLHHVLAAGLATAMMKRSSAGDDGPNASRARTSSADRESMPEMERDSGSEGESNKQEVAAQAGDDFAVTIAVPRLHTPVVEESVYGTVDYSSKPFVTPTSFAAVPEVTYRRFPTAGTASLKDVCREAAEATLTENTIYQNLWHKVRDKLDANPDRLTLYKESIGEDSYTFEALLCMKNALFRSDDREPYLTFAANANVPDQEKRTFELCVQLRGLVQGLEQGCWHASGNIDNMGQYVNDMDYEIDPRDVPVVGSGAQELGADLFVNESDDDD